MNHSKRQIAFSAVLALLLYLVPNLVQDIHRIGGHHDYRSVCTAQSGTQVCNYIEKCVVCVFEFNVVEAIANFHYVAHLRTGNCLFTVKPQDQIHKRIVHYFNLRAPPQT